MMNCHEGFFRSVTSLSDGHENSELLADSMSGLEARGNFQRVLQCLYGEDRVVADAPQIRKGKIAHGICSNIPVRHDLGRDNVRLIEVHADTAKYLSSVKAELGLVRVSTWCFLSL